MSIPFPHYTNATRRCPYCRNYGVPQTAEHRFEVGGEQVPFEVAASRCPACGRVWLLMTQFTQRSGPLGSFPTPELIWPSATQRPVAPEVPERYAELYREASDILERSPRGSAALSRRCLQELLRDVGGVQERDLASEIDAVMKAGRLPGHLATSLDAVREIGNFAAHPMKSTESGQVMDVEDGEAEWNLSVLEGLFDFFFVQPALTARRRANLNVKLVEAGRRPLPDGTEPPAVEP